MNTWLLTNESIVRVGVFLGIFSVMAMWEVLASRRELTMVKGKRWFANLGLVVIDTAVVRLLFPAAAVGMALAAEEFGWGLIHRGALPEWAAVLLSIVLLDLAIYLQHAMFHAIPALWRLHMVHHADVDFDVTTGIRFHPVEIVLSMLIHVIRLADGHVVRLTHNKWEDGGRLGAVAATTTIIGSKTRAAVRCARRGALLHDSTRDRSGVEAGDDHAETGEDCAFPSANILFSTVHPTIASRFCASNPFARRLPPKIRLYRRNVPSTRACCR